MTAANDPTADPLLKIDGLKVHFRTEDGVAEAVDGVTLTVRAGETLGVVGESGCGKSVTAMSVLRLVPQPPAMYPAGKIHYAGKDLLTIPDRQLQKIRGNEIAFIFQEPMTSLNPVFTVGNQVAETVMLHRKMSRKEAKLAAIEALRRVGIPSPERRVDEYPHQLSGGMKQRVMIAMALACDPQLLIADEPTTALDVTIQAQILDLLRKLQDEFGMGILLITHDLGVIAETAHRVAVMYGGRVVEEGSAEEVFGHPRHPYTVGLFRSLPSLGERRGKLASILGTVPSPLDFPVGCRFRNRCELATAECEEIPPLEGDGEHRVACFHPIDAEDI